MTESLEIVEFWKKTTEISKKISVLEKELAKMQEDLATKLLACIPERLKCSLQKPGVVVGGITNWTGVVAKALAGEFCEWSHIPLNVWHYQGDRTEFLSDLETLNSAWKGNINLKLLEGMGNPYVITISVPDKSR